MIVLGDDGDVWSPAIDSRGRYSSTNSGIAPTGRDGIGNPPFGESDGKGET